MTVRSLLICCLVFPCISAFAQRHDIPNFTPPRQPMPLISPNTVRHVPDRTRARFKEKGGPEYTYEIHFKNDSVATIKGRLYQSFAPDAIVIGDEYDMIIIRPEETTAVFRVVTKNSKIRGIPSYDHWLFLIVDGMIKGYSTHPEKGSSSVTYIQTGDSDFCELTGPNLRFMANEDEDVMRLIDRDNLTKALLVYNEKFEQKNIRAVGAPQEN